MWYTKIHARIHIDNRNQHCQSHEPCSQNKAIERHLLVMKNVGFTKSNSVFVWMKTKYKLPVYN